MVESGLQPIFEYVIPMFKTTAILVFAALWLGSCSSAKKGAKTTTAGTVPEQQIPGTKQPAAMKDSFLYQLMAAHPQYFDTILHNMDEYRVQIAFTRIDRGANQLPVFTDHFFNTGQQLYFYPASTVKLPVAILALQKLKQLKTDGLNRQTSMITGAAYSGETEVLNDPTAKDGRPTIEQYIKKILLVSDNDAFNRLYEFLGQEYINESLHHMGYTETQIIHRLSIFLSEDENRHTNPVSFYNDSNQLIYQKPLEKSNLKYAKRNDKMGKGYISGDDKLVNEPFDLSKKNRLALTTLHNVLKSLFFPASVPAAQRFDLNDDDRKFLFKYMSMYAPESKMAGYDDTSQYWNSYVKFLYYGADKNMPVNPSLRIFNKVGDAYGFLTDAAYFVDAKNGVEFFLSATIHCNSDGIYNDSKYDYETIGLPFMKHLGQVIYDMELQRKKNVAPDLSTLQFNYVN